jgi:ring-1,2-phenylacetyl-CoA epoxidase subunit PaaC
MITPPDSSSPPLRSSDEQSVGDPDLYGGSSNVTGLAGYVLALADDALVAAQRMGEWIAASPQIEEDVALGNIGLDLLGQARSLLSHAGSLMDPVRDEDGLAYFRDADEFRNVHLVERPWGSAGGRDFGVAMARLLLLSTYLLGLYTRLQTSTDETLAAVAAKAVKEVDYHHDHATLWVLRLGDGTEESHQRIQAALDAEWAYVDELFDAAYVDPRLLEQGVAVDPTDLRDSFDQRIADVLAQATLRLPPVAPAPGGGRRGEHGGDLVTMLADMQSLAREHPGVTW